MNIVAIIPARGGSKGIKRKNLIEIGGESLVVHSIKHALRSKSIDRVIVSTDDDEIAKISIKNGAEVPFMRPKRLAEDEVLDLPVFEHALSYLLNEENYKSDIVVHLRPTAPYRKEGWIDEAVHNLINNADADSVRSVSLVEQHPYRVFQLNGDGYLEPLLKSHHKFPYLLRRQDLPDMYFYNCVLDITKYNTIFNKKSMTGDKMIPFILDQEDVFDIDSERDFEVAKILLKSL